MGEAWAAFLVERVVGAWFGSWVRVVLRVWNGKKLCLVLMLVGFQTCAWYLHLAVVVVSLVYVVDLEIYFVDEVEFESLAVFPWYRECAGVLDKWIEWMAQEWFGNLVDLVSEALSGSYVALVLEVGPGVWCRVLAEAVVLIQDVVWFEDVIGVLVLSEAVKGGGYGL